jgi:(p)ppGpp synthase/HD superfamily hydrolase
MSHPPPAPTLQDAIRLALDAHRGQKDRYGAAYVLHPLRMMNRLTAEPDRIAAVLHDVVEDTATTVDDLRRLGFGEEIITAVDCLTKRRGEHYDTYIERCKVNPIARRVKLADLEDNLDLRRLDEVRPQDLERLNRYLKAWRYLNESA